MNSRIQWLLTPSLLNPITIGNQLGNATEPVIKSINYITPGTITSSSNPTFQVDPIKTTPESTAFGQPMSYWKALRPVLP